MADNGRAIPLVETEHGEPQKECCGCLSRPKVVKNIGITHTVLGIISIVSGILAIIFAKVVSDYFYWWNPRAYFGSGIWGGTMFTALGIVLIHASKFKTICPFVAALVLSIIGLPVAAIDLMFVMSGPLESTQYVTNYEVYM
ncbi:uncharacterized protein LOC100183330 [Ciona intestinalis]